MRWARAPSARVIVGVGNEYESSRRRRALQEFVRAARIRERQPLRDDPLDLATMKQLERREEVLPKSILVNGRVSAALQEKAL